MYKLENNDYEYFMNLALAEAEKAYKLNEVPVGAVIIDDTGKLIGKGHNNKEVNNDPCGHAEILAIKEATSSLEDWRLNKATLFVTLEPCLMCMGALSQARIGRLVFGAYDKKGGALSLKYDISFDGRLNHRFSVVGGVRHYECSRLLSQFFREKRNKYNFRN